MPFLAPFFSIAKAIPIWAWALAAVLCWGAFQKHQATRATKAAAVAEQQAAVEAAANQLQAEHRAKEAELNAVVTEEVNGYLAKIRASEQSELAARTELERVRNLLARGAKAGSPGQNPSAPSGSDGAAELSQMLGECATHLEGLGRAAGKDARKLEFLQRYAQAVGVAKGAASAPQAASEAGN